MVVATQKQLLGMEAMSRTGTRTFYVFGLAQKQTLLYRFVQLGIDHYGLVKNGANWGNVGGTIGPGRKMQILFAGLMLGKPEMINIAKSWLVFVNPMIGYTWIFGMLFHLQSSPIQLFT